MLFDGVLIDILVDLDRLPGDKRYYKLLAEEAILHARKNRDYSGDQDPLANLRECEKMGVRMFDGIMVRLSDKWSRAMVLIKRMRTTGEGPAVVDESLEDTLRDLAVYAKLAIVALQERSIP
jgi:hypothetical protein